ncbi:hypothetical protein GCM10022402_08910 [Salinactinospora qingdaonensis]|uniref:Uncharacterized protein n=1 Tax=Salinactinospora qingdaonensis TaxID=702744 RepID=A0ABP7F8D6_9ACTN
MFWDTPTTVARFALEGGARLSRLPQGVRRAEAAPPAVWQAESCSGRDWLE